MDIVQKLHINDSLPRSLADITSPARHIERKPARPHTQSTGFPSRRKELANPIKSLRHRPRIGPRTPDGGRLIHYDQARDALSPLDTVAIPVCLSAWASRR